jgi:hypothetical protein
MNGLKEQLKKKSPKMKESAENFTFLPKELIPKKAKYFVWYTGTLGQAEWLITFSKKLRGSALPISCKDNLSNAPESIMPLLVLEQPDLIVTDEKYNPLISIEITEQQAFGTNAQQRVARLWSALANKIPSAYLLPLESYQIEKRENAEKIQKILCEPDEGKRTFLLFCETLLNINCEKTYLNGIKSIEDLKKKIREGDYSKIAGITKETINQLQVFLKRFVDNDGETVHLQNIPPEEHYHKVGNAYYVAYIRKPEVTDSMLLEWFNKASMTIPTYAFKLQSELVNLFRTDGRLHIIHDAEHSHLSYRNLPPRPKQTPVVHKFGGNKKDEIELFFDFVDAAIEKDYSNDFLRKRMMRAGEYWDESIIDKWTKDPEKLEIIKSGDFCFDKVNFFKVLFSGMNKYFQEYLKSFDKFDEVHVYKIYNTAPKRGLYDPYSGNLAVRDILFTRDLGKNDDLIKFNRIKPLVFLVDFKGESAKDHPFISRIIDRIYHKHFVGNSKENASAQDKLIWLLKNLKLSQIPKDIRCHVIFSDIIIVRRHFETNKTYEILFGVPTLLRMGIIKDSDVSMKSLRI